MNDELENKTGDESICRVIGVELKLWFSFYQKIFNLSMFHYSKMMVL